MSVDGYLLVLIEDLSLVEVRQKGFNDDGPTVIMTPMQKSSKTAPKGKDILDQLAAAEARSTRKTSDTNMESSRKRGRTSALYMGSQLSKCFGLPQIYGRVVGLACPDMPKEIGVQGDLRAGQG